MQNPWKKPKLEIKPHENIGVSRRSTLTAGGGIDRRPPLRSRKGVSTCNRNERYFVILILAGLRAPQHPSRFQVVFDFAMLLIILCRVMRGVLWWFETLPTSSRELYRSSTLQTSELSFYDLLYRGHCALTALSVTVSFCKAFHLWAEAQQSWPCSSYRAF